MNLQLLQAFFFWCMVINSAVYVISAVFTVLFNGFMCFVMKKVFEYEKEESLKAVQGYLANYKLFITVFNFTPWIATIIISQGTSGG